ncbi:hypothetical protein ES705_10349 [subsurface metagenome]
MNWIQRFLTAIATHKANANAHHTPTVAGDLNLADLAEKAHGSLTGVTSNQHHPQAHTLGSHSTKAHTELTGVTAAQHHAKYTSAEADARIALHAAIAAAHHAAFTAANHTAIGNGAPHHARYIDAEAQAVADARIALHAAIAAAHHAKYTNAEAKAAAVQAGAITNGVTKAPTHDAVYDVKAVADAAQTAAEVAALILTHKNLAAAHHAKTTSATEITSGVLPSISRLPALTTGKIWQGAANRPSEVDVPAAGGATFLTIAAADTPATLKNRADYVGNGTYNMGDVAGDEAEINTALGIADTVILCPGTYWVNNPISMASGQTLLGGGAGCVIKIRDSKNATLYMIKNSDPVSGNDHIVIKNLKLDGNKANNAAGTQHGIYFAKVAPSGTTPGCKIEGCFVENFRNYGIYLISSSNNTISGNTCRGNNGYGIYFFTSPSNNNIISGNTCLENGGGIQLASSNNSTISGNICLENGDAGIFVTSSSNNSTISGNICSKNHHGIELVISFNNTISGNICQGNDNRGIWIASSNNNTISGNTCLENSQGKDNYNHNIFLGSSDYNLIVGNICRKASVATTLDGAHSATDTTLLLADATGFWVGGGITIDPGGVKEETHKITDISDNTVTIEDGLDDDQANGEEVIAPRTEYGINVSNDACDRNCLVGNDLYDSGETGDLNDVPTTNPTLKHDNRNLAGTGWLVEV